MRNNFRHISGYYLQIKEKQNVFTDAELNSFLFGYDADILEDLLTFIRRNIAKIESELIEFSAYNPPKSEDSPNGYIYPENMEPAEYWRMKFQDQLNEFKYFENKVSKVYQFKLPININDNEINVYNTEFIEVERPQLKDLFKSNDLYDIFISKLIELNLIDSETRLHKPVKGNIATFASILRALFSKGYVNKLIKDQDITYYLFSDFGIETTYETVRKAKISPQNDKRITI